MKAKEFIKEFKDIDPADDPNSGMDKEYLQVYLSSFLKIESDVNEHGRYIQVFFEILTFIYN